MSKTSPPRTPPSGSPRERDEDTGGQRKPAGPLPPDAASAADDPGTNRTHPLPDDRAGERGPGGDKFEEKCPHTAGQQ